MFSLLLSILILTAGCVAPRYELAAPGELPSAMAAPEIPRSAYFEELKRTYGSGFFYEQAKIKYLLEQTAQSGYSFDRNGLVYDPPTTAKHLRKKYRQRLKRIKTARDFIDKVASISSVSGRPYLVLPGDGRAYRTGDVLYYELERLEDFMDTHH